MAPTTVDAALKDLISEGLLVARVGSGTYMAEGSAEKLAKMLESSPANGSPPRTGRPALSVLVSMTRENLERSQSPHVILRGLDGVAKACRSHGVPMTLSFMDPYDHVDFESLAGAVGALGEGAVIFQEELADRLGARLGPGGAPYMLLDAPTRTRNVVHVDFRTAYEKALDHLHEIGRDRIAYIGLDPSSASSHLGVLERILRSRGMAFEYVCWLEPHMLDRQMPSALAGKIVPRGIQAIVCRTDLFALKALEHLAAMGVAVPGAMSVIGYDDVAAAAASSPPLTTIRHPFERLGEAAVEKVLEMIAAKQTECEAVHVEAEFVVRGSSAPSARQTEEAASAAEPSAARPRQG